MASFIKAPDVEWFDWRLFVAEWAAVIVAVVLDQILR